MSLSVRSTVSSKKGPFLHVYEIILRIIPQGYLFGWSLLLLKDIGCGEDVLCLQG